MSKIISVAEKVTVDRPFLFEDHSLVYRSDEKAHVDRNIMGRNGDGATFAKTTYRISRPSVLGDKFSSRSAQKGTNGRTLPDAQMPFSATTGLKPDLFLNPHAIPSRMTIPHLLEMLLGPALTECGYVGDATPFNEYSIPYICQLLSALGLESHGNHLMVDAVTGKTFPTLIFMGPCFYQRLKHMVADKQHSRDIGQNVVLTRQPSEGRARDGGFRIGEMERDVILSHGTSTFCHDRYYTCSDKFKMYVCRRCGMPAIGNNGEEYSLKHQKGWKNVDAGQYRRLTKWYDCKNCSDSFQVVSVEVPYCFKLFCQELTSVNIVPRLAFHTKVFRGENESYN